MNTRLGSPRSARALLLSMLLLSPVPAAAQNNHFVSASIGQGSPEGESSYDPEVSFVDALWSSGVPGTMGGGREISASADSASGLMQVSGLSDNTLNGNRKSASARIDQRMRPNDDGPSGPVTVIATLSVSGGGAPYARSYGELAMDGCSVFVVNQVGGGSPGLTAGENDCDDNSSVNWTASAGAGGLSIQADYASRPSAVYVSANVLGQLGNGTVDVATGSFTTTGRLNVRQLGGANPPTYYSDTFLTVPEPGAGALSLAVIGSLALLARRGR